MDVAIVTPAYNAEKYLAETIRSIQAQTVTNWELVIVDDGSQDSTGEIGRAFAERDARLRVLRQNNMGLAGARNRGIQALQSDAPYITFLDADDVWEPNALALLIQKLEAHPNAVGAHGVARFIDENSRPCYPGEAEKLTRERQAFQRGRMVDWPLGAPTTFAVLICQNRIWTPAQAPFRKKTLDAIGLFDTALSPTADWDMWLRLTQHGDLAFLDQVVINYRRHGNNMSGNQQMMQEFALAVRKKMLCSKQYTPASRRIAKQLHRVKHIQIYGQILELALRALMQRQFLQSARMFRHAYRRYALAMRGVPIG